MAVLNVQVPLSTGLAAVYAQPTASDQCVTGTGVVLDYRNTSGTVFTVTLVTPQLIDGDLAVADRAVSIPATTGQKFIAVPDLYRDPATGLCLITISPAPAAGLGRSITRLALPGRATSWRGPPGWSHRTVTAVASAPWLLTRTRTTPGSSAADSVRGTAASPTLPARSAVTG